MSDAAPILRAWWRCPVALLYAATCVYLFVLVGEGSSRLG
jgi:hypothetical protein